MIESVIQFIQNEGFVRSISIGLIYFVSFTCFLISIGLVIDALPAWFFRFLLWPFIALWRAYSWMSSRWSDRGLTKTESVGKVNMAESGDSKELERVFERHQRNVL